MDDAEKGEEENRLKSKLKPLENSRILRDFRSAADDMLSPDIKEEKETASKTGIKEEETASKTGIEKEETASNTGIEKEETASNTGIEKEETASNTGIKEEETASNTGIKEEETASKTGIKEEETASKTGIKEEETASKTGIEEEETASKTGIKEEKTVTGPNNKGEPVSGLKDENEIDTVEDNLSSAISQEESEKLDDNHQADTLGIKSIGPSEGDKSLLSDLIMPGEAELDIDGLKTRLGDSRVIEHRRVTLPDKVESVWEKTLQEITQIEGEEIKPKVEEVSAPAPSLIHRIINRFERQKVVLEDYDVEKHGAIVNLSMDENSPYEEVELYPVNEPYSYVRISYNPTTHTYLYQSLEPELTPGETELLDDLKLRLTETLDMNLKELEESGAKKYLKDKVTDILWDYQIQLDTLSFTKIMYYIYVNFMGYGIIDPLMHDAFLEDISCDGPFTPIYVYHRKYESIETDLHFDNEEQLDAFVVRIAQICGRHISIADPLLDATMPDGSRIQMTLGREVTTRGSSFTIRKFKESPLTPPDLIDLHTYSTATVAYLWLAAENNKNIIFAGGTASGKTTSMNAIALFIPPETKIVSIEDTRELNLPHPNWIAGVTRETFTGSETGAIDMYDLLKAALRQRPEYLLVGEVRGAEAYVLFQAMSTGHTTFSTMHADSVTSVVHRLENPPINVPRIMLQALDIIIVQVQTRVHEQRVRRAKSLTEIVGVDARTGELLTNEVFTWAANKDEYIYSGRSYVLESIMKNRGWDDNRLKEELKRRQEILEWARMKNVKHYEDVAKIVVTYYREPESMLDIVRQELYGS